MPSLISRILTVARPQRQTQPHFADIRIHRLLFDLDRVMTDYLIMIEAIEDKGWWRPSPEDRVQAERSHLRHFCRLMRELDVGEAERLARLEPSTAIVPGVLGPLSDVFEKVKTADPQLYQVAQDMPYGFDYHFAERLIPRMRTLDSLDWLKLFLFFAGLMRPKPNLLSQFGDVHVVEDGLHRVMTDHAAVERLDVHRVDDAGHSHVVDVVLRQAVARTDLRRVLDRFDARYGRDEHKPDHCCVQLPFPFEWSLELRSRGRVSWIRLLTVNRSWSDSDT